MEENRTFLGHLYVMWTFKVAQRNHVLEKGLYKASLDDYLGGKAYLLAVYNKMEPMSHSPYLAECGAT